MTHFNFKAKKDNHKGEIKIDSEVISKLKNIQKKKGDLKKNINVIKQVKIVDIEEIESVDNWTESDEPA